jgi:uncharacterized protein (UPF0332 family)
MTEEVEKYMEKAEKSLRVAKELFEKGHFDDACSKAYYVMFYAAQALLKNIGIDVSKHSAVVAKFGQHFAKTGKIDPKYHRFLIDAKKKRETADYDVFSFIGEEITKERISWAEDFLKKIRQELGKVS